MEDRVVCSCLDVTYNTIKEAIENGAKTLDDIKDETEAGTICGMCEDEIIKSALKLHQSGIEVVVVSIGGDGALLVSKEGIYQGRPPKILK